MSRDLATTLQLGQQSKTQSQKNKNVSKKKKKSKMGWVWWLIPVIPAPWEAKVDRSFEVRSLRPAWPTW